MANLMEILTLSKIRGVFNFCNKNSIDFRKVLENLLNEEPDFTVDDYRFISVCEIDDIQVSELKSDPYILGCFNADFLEGITGLPSDIIKIVQEADEYEKLGDFLINRGFVNKIQENYVRYDTYGHHFSTYDSNTIEDLADDDNVGYYVFRV